VGGINQVGFYNVIGRKPDQSLFRKMPEMKVKRKVMKREITKGIIVCALAISAGPSLASTHNERGHQAHMRSQMDAFLIDMFDADSDARSIAPSAIGSVWDLSTSLNQIGDLTGLVTTSDHSGFEMLILLSNPADFDQDAPFGALTSSNDAGTLSNLIHSNSSVGISPSKLSSLPDPSFPVAPIPPAVLSGLGMLAGLAGIRLVRTRK